MTGGASVSGPLAPPGEALSDGTIELVPLGRAHLEPLAALGSDPLVQRYTRVPEHFGAKEAEWWLGLYERGWGDGSRAGFAIVEHLGATFVGMIAFVTLRLEEIGLARIELRAELENPASLKVAERCGYVREGTLRNVHVKHGRRGDMALFSRIA